MKYQDFDKTNILYFLFINTFILIKNVFIQKKYIKPIIIIFYKNKYNFDFKLMKRIFFVITLIKIHTFFFIYIYILV